MVWANKVKVDLRKNDVVFERPPICKLFSICFQNRQLSRIGKTLPLIWFTNQDYGRTDNELAMLSLFVQKLSTDDIIKGPSIKDVRSKLGLFDPLPPLSEL